MISHVDVRYGTQVYCDGIRYLPAVQCGDCKYIGYYKKKYFCCRRKCLVPVSFGSCCSYGVNDEGGEQE